MAAEQPISTAHSPPLPRGLTSSEAAERRETQGPNELGITRQKSWTRQVLPLLLNPLAIILLVSAVLAAAVGEVTSAVVIIAVVLLGAAINFVQTYRSQVAIDRLRAEVAPTASVCRDGVWKEIPRSEVVAGDVIRLSAGDLVPADAVLVDAKHLHVQQAMLTGESLPVEKEPQNPAEQAGELNRVFLGTSIVSGNAVALVEATGSRTMFGDVLKRLAVRPPETEFDRGTRRFGLLIMKTVFVLVLFTFFVTAVSRHNPFESLLFAIALAVGLTPEFLPMITAVTLARGALRMAKQNAIVKHLAAMQNFGSIDVLCCDKTGTLTVGEMRLELSLDPSGAPSDRPFELARINSELETGITNPLDTAILARPSADGGTPVKIDEIPFDFERRRVSIVVDRVGSGRLLVCKGSPEGLLDACSLWEVAGSPTPFDAEAKERCTSTFQRLSKQGLRVLAVAQRSVPTRDAYGLDDERDLTLVGFLGFLDPPREDAATAIENLRRDGVEVKILTGDNELVTEHICAKVGVVDDSEVVLGSAIDRMTDAALAHVVENSHVFARVSPAQKNRIILALKSRSHVVGFLGDGVNDTPSLHAADVGITVSTAVDVAKEAAEIVLLEPGLRVLHTGIMEGRKAFGNVMKYLLMGTSSNFGNMFSMAGAVVFLPFLPMLPMQILLNNFLYDLAQITIPTDNVDASFMKKPRKWDIKLIRNFMMLVGPISSLYDFLTFWVLLKVFHLSEAAFHTGWFIESLATQTLVVFVIRTADSPFKSRPSVPLLSTVLLVVLIGALLPVTPLAAPLGFVPLPWRYFAFLAVATTTYLALVELGKRRLTRGLLAATG